MADGLTRLAVVLVVAAAAVIGGLIWRRGRAWVRRRRPFPGFADGVYLFTSATCASCSPARALLDATGVGYREIAFESEPALFEEIGVEKVPAVARVSAGQGWIAFGLPAGRAIGRWLRGA